MDSLYEKYLLERTNDKIIRCDFGFATYRYLDEGKTVYIVDIFVLESYRRDGWAGLMADKIAQEAKAKGSNKMIGTVVPSTKNSTLSLQVLIGYGMTLDYATNDLVVFKKEI